MSAQNPYLPWMTPSFFFSRDDNTRKAFLAVLEKFNWMMKDCGNFAQNAIFLRTPPPTFTRTYLTNSSLMRGVVIEGEK